MNNHNLGEMLISFKGNLISTQAKKYCYMMFLLTVFLMALQPVKKVQAVPDHELRPEIDLERSQYRQTNTEQDFDSAFGTKGQKHWYIQGAAAGSVDENDGTHFGLLGGGASQFFANGHSISAELNSLYFNQNGDDAAGLNFNLLLRFHFYRRQNWSLFFDGGAGIIGMTNKVPTGGSDFNFTPQVGGGATIRIAEQKRLMLGLRWHHISNADTFDKNPGLDSIMGYVGIILPR
jgi:lipid A 3-O-deacylase